MQREFLGIEEAYRQVKDRMGQAARRSGRDPGAVTLVAVTKTQPVEKIHLLYALGHRIFGENRIQEAQEKIPQFPGDVQWHMIGHLQSNKAKLVPGLFTCLHSLDSVSAVREMGKVLGPERRFPVLLELHTSDEASKMGVRTLDELQALAEAVLTTPGLELRGLMTMAPFTPEETPIRKSFRSLFEARERLRTFTGLALPELSMGMSNDFEWAIEEGATLVRVGSILFGARS